MSSAVPSSGGSGQPFLGPGSLLWQYLGDRRFILMLPRAVCLQSLHPAISAATIEHSRTPNRIWLHKRLTVRTLVRAAYSRRHALMVKGAHENVKGRDALGKRYHSLNPELFFFQHATYVDTLVAMMTTLVRPLSGDELEQLYQETCLWYRSYGVSSRPMPRSWPEFQDYFEHVCATQLMVTSAFEHYRADLLRPRDWLVAAVPSAVVRAMQHQRARQLAGISVSPSDWRALRLFGSATRLAARSPLWRYPGWIRLQLESENQPGRRAGAVGETRDEE